MKLQKSIRIDMKVAAFLIIFSTINFFLNPIDAYGFSSLREITYKNINTVLTAEDLDLQGDSNDYTFYIAPIGSDSAERISLPLSLDENIYLGTNDLTILGPQGIVTVKVVVTEASREVDRDGWTKIEASEDTRIVYVSSSEGDDAAGVPHYASDIGVATPDDEPQGPFLKRITPIMTDYTDPQGEVSASSEWGWGNDAAWKAFNRNPNGRSNGWIGSRLPSWLLYQFASSRVVTAYSIRFSINSQFDEDRVDQAPKDWTFEGSNDGENWTTLDTVTGETDWNLGERRLFAFSNTTEYEYYRIFITDANGSSRPYISELEILGPSEEMVPVQDHGLAERLVRSGYPDWILFKRGDEWGGGSISPGSGRSLVESSVLGAYGESNTRPYLQELSVRVTDNLIVNGLDIWNTTTRGHNVLVEGCNYHITTDTYISGGSNRSNFEMRRSIISEPQQNGLEMGFYISGATGILFEEILFNLHTDQTLSESSQQGRRNMFYIQASNRDFRAYRNIITNSVRNAIQARSGGLSIMKENILSQNPFSLWQAPAGDGRSAAEGGSSILMKDNVIIDGRSWDIRLSNINDDIQNVVSGNIISNVDYGGSSHGISMTTHGGDHPLKRINIYDNITYGNVSFPSSGPSGSEDIQIFNNVLNQDGDFVDPNRTLGTYHSYVSGDTYEDSSGLVNVVNDGDSNYSKVEWVSGDKFDSDWGRPDAAKIVIDGATYKIYEVINDENITLTDWDSSGHSLPSYWLPESGMLEVSYVYESNQLAHRDFIESAKEQSRQNWDWDYHPVKIQDYFREGFAVGSAPPGAPEEVADLKAETLSETDGKVLLSWTATGKNGNNIGGFYEVRYATYTAEEKSSVSKWWDSIPENPDKYKAGASVFENPKNVGDTEERIVDRLHPGTTFYFGIRVYNSELEKSGFDTNLSEGNPASAAAGNADPGPPSRLRFNYIGTNARLVWDKSTSFVLKKYIVHKSTLSEGSVKSTKTVCGAETEYDICLKEEGYFADYDKYYFTVTAVNIVESTSTHSNEVKLTPDVTPPVIEDLTARTRVLGRKEIKVSVTDDRQVYEVGGGYRSLGSGFGEYQELEFFPDPEEGSPSYEGSAEIDEFYISSEGFEYYITASDAFNTSTTTWVQVRSAKDLPEQGFITPNNPELIFGSEVKEVLITDVRGNEVFSEKRGSSNYIVWNPSRDGSISLESGLYIYRIKIDGEYKYGSVVIAK